MSKTSSGGQGPRRRRRRLWLVALLVLVAAAGGYGWYARPWEPKVQQVAAEVLAPSSVSQVLAVNGRVAAGRQVTVRAAVAAQVLRIGADEGDDVAAGDMLVTLDPAVIEAQVEQARAALEAQQARQLQAQTALERARALGENTTRSSREDAELALAASEKQTAGLEAALAEVQRQAENYVIRAPIGGVVLSRDVDVGQLVDPQSALFVVADTSDLIVETDVDELYSARVMPGLKALLQPVGASVAQHGTVVFAAPSVDSSTGGRAIRIAFVDEVALPVGLTVNANVIVDEVPDALSLPRSAIVTEGAESHVLVIAEGRAEMRPITFNDWPADRVIVTSGLAAGDVVIVDATTVEPGALVAANLAAN